MFKDLKFYFNTAKFSKNRISLFETQVLNNGGLVVKSSGLATHIVVEESCDKSTLPTSFWSDNKTKVIGSIWLSQCLKKNDLVDEQNYLINIESKKRSVEESASLETNSSISSLNPGMILKNEVEASKHVCSQASAIRTNCCNELVLSQLQKLAETYRIRGDQWRAYGYEKAISAIRRYGKEITSHEEVAALEGVGSKMAAKVLEIISTGSLRKVAELCDTEESRVKNIFSNVWGAGPSAANSWYLKGHRSLSDLLEKETLTKQQQIGVKYYQEFLEKMLRSEVENIADKVNSAAVEVDSSLTTMLCGSYRRGKLTCGDVDVVVIKADRLVAKDILTAILSKLKESGFITDDLVSLEKSGNQRKYLGVCKLPGENQLHRRLDIFVVPRSESACAILHYTGSALFNRSIRTLAAKKNMHLSEHNLSAGVVRQGSEILNNGYILPTPTEESIFEHLGLEFRPPEERDH